MSVIVERHKVGGDSGGAAVALVLLNNPPVNSLGAKLRTELDAKLADLATDPGVEAVVIMGMEGVFSGGADIAEFSDPAADAPMLPDVLSRIETFPKTCVAAIRGYALGGGLELALACHYRVIHAAARVGLPEVQIGLLPGAGGTQRLPRVAGLKVACEMIVSGRPMSAGQALVAGVVDELVEDDKRLLLTALELAHSPPHEHIRFRRSFMRRIPDKADGPAIIAAARKAIAFSARGQVAPQACLDALEAAYTMSFRDAMQRERELITSLFASPQARALQYAFFSQRKASRAIDGPQQAITRVAVIGCGTMGSGIAMVFAAANIPALVVETDEQALERGRKRILAVQKDRVKRGRITAGAMDALMSNLTFTLDWEQLKDADLVVEAVFENMQLKKDVFARLDDICRPEAILCSNTSYLDIDELAATTRRPHKVVGLHFFSPAHVMPLVEIVRGRLSATPTMATVTALVKRVGKIGVVVGVCNGFVGNRMLGPYANEALHLLEEGCTPEQVDQALVEFGFPMGPFVVSDLAGLDIGWRRRKDLGLVGKGPQAMSDKLVELGRLGQKSGAGWYAYTNGRSPKPDPAVADVIRQHAEARGIAQRTISRSEIVDRCLAVLINEGFKVLDEQIAQRPGDIDTIYINGYGFPRFRGGPMWYAEHSMGLDKVLEVLQRFGAQARDKNAYWEPSALLEKLVRRKVGVQEFFKKGPANFYAAHSKL